MVAQQILTLFVLVRIQIAQVNPELSGFFLYSHDKLTKSCLLPILVMVVSDFLRDSAIYRHEVENNYTSLMANQVYHD